MRKSKIGVVITAAGALLILCATILLLWNIWRDKQVASQNEETVNKILNLLPDRTNGAPDDRTDTKMPVLEINGLDYICLIEVPNGDIRFPVLSGKDQNHPNVTPYRYRGTVSDGSLVIGGLQPDFLSCIETDDTIILTDMNGSCYTYTVTGIEHADKISETLSAGDDNLVLFTGNKWGLDYIVVRLHFT